MQPAVALREAALTMRGAERLVAIRCLEYGAVFGGSSSIGRSATPRHGENICGAAAKAQIRPTPSKRRPGQRRGMLAMHGDIG